ncbi:uncharacterized protein LOC116850455 isoform X1 [Odontomachus brunneus]|uniref:uncharacterized protein LOC116850455 isoform X1 n=1 Tax=Odontomachus brunneus TaxID=486640 RepID=UPI0013F2384C|nr:uncharacterized protein LOC116850455 isoform X1 [Odontomachus brunneus]XP_032684659.1 uncharacterized protein LOC116850455 isoform X1 [Odontomachus brunneus]XP_032684660.1 uncharacterized protein LOC116850455 isoform X1 [Odontomachus brunneus]
MTANYDELSKEANVVETEVAKDKQNEVLEVHFVPQLEQEKIKEKPRSKPTPKTIKPAVSKVPVKRVSPRIEELARPMINNVLSTLRDKAWVLPLAAVDNLQKIIEAKTCLLSPEEAARVLRLKKRKTKKTTRFPQLRKKWTGEITKLEQASPMLDRNVALCQYLLAVNFVKSIVERQCQTQRKDLREITRVILKRLMSVDEYTDARNGNDDRAMQQLHLLAEMIACWIAEILVEVAEADKEALEEYYKKKEMKKMEVDNEETDSEVEYWEQKYETEEKSEDTIHRRENGEKDEVGDEKVEPEQRPEEDVEKKDEDEEVLEEEKEGNETQLEK